MRAPFVLRAQVAWTVLTGRYISISVGDSYQRGTAYRVDVEPRSVSWWKARRERKAIRDIVRSERRQPKAAKRAAYEKAKEVV